jgi:hypothetical protein
MDSMAIDHSNAVVQTAACEIFGRHANHQGPGACSGRLLSLTDAHLTDCTCRCHRPDQGIVQGLPDTWAEQVAAFPPCDEDLDLPDDDELDELLELEGDRLLELAAESRLFGAEL